MASALHWVPESLYNLSLSSIVSKFKKGSNEIKMLPGRILFDIYYKLYKQGKLCMLGLELMDLEVFEKVLKVNDKRHLLHHCFQALMDHGSRLVEVLADNFSQYCCMRHCASNSDKDRVINLGLSLGLFLSDAGWFRESDRVLHACLQLCKTTPESSFLVKSLECCLRLLHVRICYCIFIEAEKALLESQLIVKKLQSEGCIINLAGFYAEFSLFYFSQSKFNKAYEYGMLSLKQLNSNLPIKTVIDVIRQASKACISRRQFIKAELLIKHAVQLANEEFGQKHPTTSLVLSDYGFCLLNINNVRQAVHMYQTALKIRQCVFGGHNLLLALSHEDLAYASYVHEYSAGLFTDAREHSEKSIAIMKHLLPKDHLLFASSKRVKALILEEIAAENSNNQLSQKLLEESEELHLSALNLTRTMFGEMNVLTARHYGNLGRLYQSMKKLNEAREMHLTAISIKEELLGPEDYEVALSLGHLASLYVYDMRLYGQAEKLYLRSIEINKKLFGDGYSGLEYDYRGLLKVYTDTSKQDEVLRYRSFLEQWKLLQDKKDADCDVLPLEDFSSTMTIEQLVNSFSEVV